MNMIAIDRGAVSAERSAGSAPGSARGQSLLPDLQPLRAVHAALSGARVRSLDDRYIDQHPEERTAVEAHRGALEAALTMKARDANGALVRLLVGISELCVQGYGCFDRAMGWTSRAPEMLVLGAADDLLESAGFAAIDRSVLGNRSELLAAIDRDSLLRFRCDGTVDPVIAAMADGARAADRLMDLSPLGAMLVRDIAQGASFLAGSEESVAAVLAGPGGVTGFVNKLLAGLVIGNPRFGEDRWGDGTPRKRGPDPRRPYFAYLPERLVLAALDDVLGGLGFEPVDHTMIFNPTQPKRRILKAIADDALLRPRGRRRRRARALVA